LYTIFVMANISDTSDTAPLSSVIICCTTETNLNMLSSSRLLTLRAGTKRHVSCWCLDAAGWEFLGPSAASWSVAVVYFSPLRAASQDSASVVKFEENPVPVVLGLARHFLTRSTCFA
jgi:hypothetical protein